MSVEEKVKKIIKKAQRIVIDLQPNQVELNILHKRRKRRFRRTLRNRSNSQQVPSKIASEESTIIAN